MSGAPSGSTSLGRKYQMEFEPTRSFAYRFSRYVDLTNLHWFQTSAKATEMRDFAYGDTKKCGSPLCW